VDGLEEQGLYGKSLCFPLNFAVYLKTLFKKKKKSLFNKQQKKREAELLSFSDTTETLMDNDNTSGICFKTVRERRQVKEK